MLASWGGMIPYFAVMLTYSFQVAEGLLARWIHIISAFIAPVYIPFGIIFYIQNQYQECSMANTCDSVTIGDYMILEVWILYVALAFHTVLWAFGLRVADVIKDGGSLKSVFSHDKVRPTTNADKIDHEDDDVKRERSVVEATLEAQW